MGYEREKMFKGATKGPNGPGGHPEMIGIQNPAAKLDHAKRDLPAATPAAQAGIVAARFFEISAEAILQAAVSMEGS
ncbi:MAG: hypothetical protein DRH50_10445 [Deltaproteobacteria bacterium]|nr:MAG: hypothetical protein DRH50_10445 [Deltaproteobacteria bacterium]